MENSSAGIKPADHPSKLVTGDKIDIQCEVTCKFENSRSKLKITKHTAVYSPTYCTCSLAGRYYNPRPESTMSHSQRLRIWLQFSSPHTVSVNPSTPPSSSPPSHTCNADLCMTKSVVLFSVQFTFLMNNKHIQLLAPRHNSWNVAMKGK